MEINHKQPSPERDVAEHKYIQAFIKHFKCTEKDLCEDDDSADDEDYFSIYNVDPAEWEDEFDN